MKEAYTKALGIGLGFNFRRVEYNVVDDVVSIDGQVPKGWQFRKFEVNDGEDLYQGVAAEFVGGDETTFMSSQSAEWLVSYDAAAFVQRALTELD